MRAARRCRCAGRGAIFVDGDSVRLCQVVADLLTNAIKYSPERARIEIVIEAPRPTRSSACTIRASASMRNCCRMLFDLFLQGDRTLDRAQGGLGVGLTIVKLLVEMHGGRVSAHSAGLGKGSEFRSGCRESLAPIAGCGGAGRRTQDRASAPRARHRRQCATPPSRCARCCAPMRHEVEVVYDGAAGLAKLEDFRADIVLLDIGLPRMDGYMVAHAIRERFALAGRRPKLLALTGYGREEDRNAALKAGFDGHLGKAGGSAPPAADRRR